MSKINLAQDEQYLKSLESSIKEICEYHHRSLDLMRESWTLSMELFVITEKLRENRKSLENQEQ